MYTSPTWAGKPALRHSTRSLTWRIITIAAVPLCFIVSFHTLQPLQQKVSYLVPERSFAAFSVDDFGRWADSIPLFPDQAFMDEHAELQIANKDFWYARATVETRNDLYNLLQFFQDLNINASFEQRAVLTPHFVVGGPDFEAMRRAGCGVSKMVNTSIPDASAFDHCVYYESLITDPGPTGLAKPPYHRGDLRPAYKMLFLSGVWHPEYHGRSHFGVSKWLTLLRTDEKAQACFHNNLVCAADVTQLRSEFNSFSSKAELRRWLEAGVMAFSSFWGYRPSLISSPHNTWNNWLAEVVDDLSFVGAELAEDQASYVSRGDDLSLHDRFRFDVFFPGFECDQAVTEVVDLLNARETHPRQGWHTFLSNLNAFKPYRRGLTHSRPAGVHERFVSLMWHAQNAMSSTYSKEELDTYMGCVKKVVDQVRDNVPGAVFVTGAELHQIRSRGWSVETWDDGMILRNYAILPVDIRVPNMREVYAGRNWDGIKLYVRQITGPRSDQRKVETKVGNVLRLDSDSVYKLTW